MVLELYSIFHYLTENKQGIPAEDERIKWLLKVNGMDKTETIRLFRDELIPTMNAALKKLPVRKGISYKGAHVDSNVLAKYNVGEKITVNKFFSTSSSHTIAESFATTRRISKNTEPVIFQFRVKLPNPLAALQA